MALDYPQTITVISPPPADGLGRTTGTPTASYDGPADVQEGAVVRTGASGQAFRIGDAKAFLPDFRSATLDGITEGDAVTITWQDGSTQAATVAETSRLDASLVLTYSD